MDKKLITVHILQALEKQHKLLEELERFGFDNLPDALINYEAMTDVLFMIWGIPECSGSFSRDYWGDSIFEFVCGEKNLTQTVDDFENWDKNN